jgi:hypothetical protein
MARKPASHNGHTCGLTRRVPSQPFTRPKARTAISPSGPAKWADMGPVRPARQVGRREPGLPSPSSHLAQAHQSRSWRGSPHSLK